MSLTKLFAAALLALATPLAGAADFSSLEERMSGDEFSAAGLDQLTPDQLARLNAWLRGQWPAAPVAATPYPAQADTRGLSQVSASRDAIVSQYDGEFTGWNAGSIIRLKNGMVWETDGSAQPLAIRGVNDPTIIIEPAMLGTWLMRVEGYNATARVKRVQ